MLVKRVEVCLSLQPHCSAHDQLVLQQLSALHPALPELEDGVAKGVAHDAVDDRVPWVREERLAVHDVVDAAGEDADQRGPEREEPRVRVERVGVPLRDRLGEERLRVHNRV